MRPLSINDRVSPAGTAAVLALFLQVAAARGKAPSAACREAGVRSGLLTGASDRQTTITRDTFLRIRNWINKGAV